MAEKNSSTTRRRNAVSPRTTKSQHFNALLEPADLFLNRINDLLSNLPCDKYRQNGERDCIDRESVNPCPHCVVVRDVRQVLNEFALEMVKDAAETVNA